MRIAAFGFVSLCATLSAAHTSDYLVSFGVACQVGHGAERELIDICVRAGLMEEVEVDGTRMWKIVDDPEFLHMRTRDEIEWERQRKADNSRPDLVIPIRLRDGDACRYCGRVVKFEPGARKGGFVGTYDHRVPKQAATVDTLVVACTACNAGRKDDPLADDRYPLLPPPSKPYYSAHTRKWIAEHPWAKANGFSITSRRGKTLPPGTVPDDRKPVVEHTQRPGSQPDNANQRPDTQSDNAPTSTRHPGGQRTPTNTQRTGSQPENATTRPDIHSDNANPQRPTSQADNANTKQPAPPAQTPDLLNPADPAEHQPPTSGKSGSGRDGSGRVGDQTSPPDRKPPSRSRSLPNSSPPRRGRRGKNRKTGT
ncbi:hypothetical protein BO226_17550 [Rhodococcus sp. 2G]|uniref:hypothetical protein n=1 Tax=Rhodococcus sp. 2G TaxID=1570939 RepID=UPI0009031DC6|nr:hypothetical protein [Rhodococcus sp. 2G]APE10778.1 hypothetical protein BO226_17550 [Rhodococcus sp. 2G]